MNEEKVLDVQVGGNHYKNFKIQPIEFAQLNKLNACEYSILKYICRHRNKSGIKDLEKAKHFIDILIQLEYSDDSCINPNCMTHEELGGP